MRPVVTEDMIAELRELAGRDPSTGVPLLAESLSRYGWQLRREGRDEYLSYFEECADLRRGLAAGGDPNSLAAAARTLSSLALQYSLAHADDQALAARLESAVYARRAAARPEDVDTEILFRLAHSLAEAGRAEEAVAVQREVLVANGSEWGSGVMWNLLYLAVYLDLAGQTEASLEAERELLRREQSYRAIWTAGSSLRFAAAGHHDEAGRLLREACATLPAVGDGADFQFRHALQTVLLARSGARDEPGGPDRPVFGTDFEHWSFSRRDAYRAGVAAIDAAIAACDDPRDLGTLLRRRAIRTATLTRVPKYYEAEVITALARIVDLERRLCNDHGPARLVRALTDQAMAVLVAGDDATALLREAIDLHGPGTVM